MKLRNAFFLAGSLCSAFMVIAPGSAAAALSGDRFYFGVGAQYFEWAEFDGGNQILQEKGPKLVLDLGYDNYNRTSTGRLNAISLSGYFGDVDYSSDAYAGETVTTEVGYNGFRIEGMLGKRWANRFRHHSWDVLLGAGYDDWKRDLKDTQLSDGTPVYGYEEKWKVFYLKVGGGWNQRSRNLFHHFRGGVRHPLWTEEKIDFFGADVTLKPGKDFGWFLEYELDILKKRNAKHGFKIAYEEQPYSQSATQIVEIEGMTGFVYQPESRQRTITAGYRFYF